VHFFIQNPVPFAKRTLAFWVRPALWGLTGNVRTWLSACQKAHIQSVNCIRAWSQGVLQWG